MIPYSTDRELQRTPWATISLIALCAVVEGICLARPDLRELLAWNPAALHWWQPLTAMFAHADPMHLIGNMVFLWVFGAHIEDALGVPRYLIIYVTAGLSAEWLQGLTDVVFLHGIRGGIGASGAIMGLVAVFALRYRSVRVNFAYFVYYRYGTFQLKAIWVGLMYVTLDLLTGMATGLSGGGGSVGNFAHVGGFVAGLAWCLILRLPDDACVDESRHEAAGLAAAGAFEAAGITMEQALTHDFDNPEVWAQAAAYYDLKPTTRSRAVPMWSTALRLYLETDQTEEALRLWRKLRPRPEAAGLAPGVLERLGIELEQSDETDEALEAYECALRRLEEWPGAAATALRAGDLALRLGRGAVAQQWYEQLRDRWPASREGLEAPGRLQRLAVEAGDDIDIRLL